MPARPAARTTLLSLHGISRHFRWVFFEELSGKLKFRYNLKRMRALYMKTKVCWILLGTRNVPDESSTENENPLCVFNNFFPENRAVYEIWKNTVQSHRSKMKIWRMRIACWIPKATNTHSQYAILTALPMQQRLHERTATLRYSTVHWLALCVNVFFFNLPSGWYVIT